MLTLSGFINSYACISAIIPPMRERFIAAGTVLLIAALCATSQQPPVVKTSICKIFGSPSDFDGKTVRIRATYAGSWEGEYLLDTKCGKTTWFTTPDGSEDVAAMLVPADHPVPRPVNFALVKDADYEKFKRFAYATVENLQREYTVTATFTGRIDHREGFKRNADGSGNGFGHMGASEFQLVLESVSDVAVERSKTILTPTTSKLPDDCKKNVDCKH
jgi:hypothetical protein